MMNGSPTLRRRRLGSILRSLREQHGKTAEEVAEATEVARTTIGRMEGGRSGIRPKFLRELLDLYGVTDELVRAELLTLAREGKQRGWWSPYASVLSETYSTYIGLEAEAESLCVYEALVIHGLLQTEAYAETVIRSAVPPPASAVVNQKVKVRLARQALLTKEKPLSVWAVLDEAVLRRTVGNRALMKEQLQHLLELTSLPNVTLQVRDFNSGITGGVGSSFTLISFPTRDDPDVTYIESPAGDVYAEGAEVDPYTLRFDHLRAAALSPDRSRDLITDVMGNFS